MRLSYLYVGIICLGLVVSFTPINAEHIDEHPIIYTVEYPTHVGVTLSKTCEVLIKNNYTTTCPTYEEINNLFPDTSVFLSGGLKNIDGFFQRESPIYEKHFNYYFNLDESIFWVDPPENIQTRIKIIKIESTILDHTISDDSISSGAISGDRIQYLGQFRTTDTSCNNSSIDSRYWKFLINDTKNFMMNECITNSTSLNSIKEIIIPKTEISILDSPNWQYQQWLKESQKLCKTLCFE